MAASPVDSTRLYARLLGYVRPHARFLIIAVLCTAIAGSTESAVAALMKPLLDGGIQPDTTPEQRLLIPLAIVGIFLIRGVFGFLGDYGMHWVANRIVQDLRNAMFARLIRLPSGYFERHASGHTMSKIVNDVAGVTAAATTVITSLVQDSVTVVALVGWLLYLNWRLTLITVVMMVLVTVAVRAFSVRMRRLSLGQQEINAEVLHVLTEAIRGQKVIKIFNGHAYEQQRFEGVTGRQRRLAMKAAVAAAAIGPIVRIFAAGALAVVVAVVMHQVIEQQATIGGFVSFITAMLLLIPSLKRLSDLNAPLQRGLAACESVFGFIDQAPEPEQGSTVLPRATGVVCFDAVSFTYQGAERPALNTVSFTAAAGEKIALVGASGSGKTTLVNLLPRFQTPDLGRVLLDGHDISTLTLASLRENIALVSQDVVLFDDTVAANIAYGLPAPVSRAAIEAAAKAAHASEFITRLPQGYDTPIGENGASLSGGQRQRLAIARALLKNAPILILDEATSALDSESEQLVQAALETLMQGRTSLIVAHRLSTIRRADRILVLREGAIVESGSHEQLLALSGTYAALWQMQFAAQSAA